MKPCVFQSILFLCIAVILLLLATVSVSVNAQKVNIFDKDKAKEWKNPRRTPAESEALKRMSQNLRHAFDPDAKDIKQETKSEKIGITVTVATKLQTDQPVTVPMTEKSEKEGKQFAIFQLSTLWSTLWLAGGVLGLVMLLFLLVMNTVSKDKFR